VLDDWKRAFPLLRQPWAGEPQGFPWQPLPALELLRQGRMHEARHWLWEHLQDDALGRTRLEA
jgi:hypothetical protein